MKPTISQVREALLAEAKSTEEMVAGADSGVRYRPEYLRELAASLDGYVLVPRRATKAMREAGARRLSYCEPCSILTKGGLPSDANQIYRAMLTAAEGEK